ncbi:CRZ1 [Candida jiufengensis]|uniref:CRZ1 n=1 Tax=Candida jiufengensis TaxID=497108 RepID=UPI002225590C|nr:CRZ1 [Candida jiufengensis]KAI5952681.1 CRZ1 [Candida jiufengensis]
MSNNLNKKQEEEDFFNVLNLSPPSNTNNINNYNGQQLNSDIINFDNNNNFDKSSNTNIQFPNGFYDNNEVNDIGMENLRNFDDNNSDFNDQINFFKSQIDDQDFNGNNYPHNNININNDNYENNNLNPYISHNASEISLNTQNIQGYNNHNQHNNNGHNNDILQQSNFLQVNHDNNFLNPHSPHQYSTQSLYSDNSSQPASPFLDATSQFSNNNLFPPEVPTAFSDVGSIHGGHSSTNLVQSNYEPENNNNNDTFLQTEIALGESISSTNLASMPDSNYQNNQLQLQLHQQQQQQRQMQLQSMDQYDEFQQGITFNSHPQYSLFAQQQQQSQQQNQHQQQSIQEDIKVKAEKNQYTFTNNQLGFDFDITITPPAQPDNSKNQFENQLENQLTENNLSSYNDQQTKQEYIKKDPSGIVISIQQAPEEIAARTPSLFSNSSANSSVNNLSRQNSNQQNEKSPNNNNLVPNSQVLPSSPNSVNEEDKDLLNLDYQSIKRGRRKSRSKNSKSSNSLLPRPRSRSSKSRSGGSISGNEDFEDDDEEGEEHENQDSTLQVSSREKMLELASPNQSSRRTQKHPSVFACHLCDKRFTRPYNLKSHLRTHTDERPFICSQCGKAFARQHDRKRHEDLHSGEKKFQCKGFLKNGESYGCGRKFARADALRRHFQTEAGKECIRSLIEEEEEEKRNGGGGGDSSNQVFLSPESTSIPQVAISPPE